MLDSIRRRVARALVPAESKAIPSLGAGVIDFHGPNGTADLLYFNGMGSVDAKAVRRETAFVVSAMCYAATHYRASNLAEAPLRVARKLEDGSFEFVPHELDPLLADPSEDYDMGETVQLTVTSLDIFAQSLWLKADDRIGRLGRLVPFAGNEFSVEAGDGRIYGRYRVPALRGVRDSFGPDEVVHFKYLSPYDRYRGVSPTDAALGWLNLGSEVEASVRRLMQNGMFPSIVISPHQEWRPDEDEYERFKRNITQYHAGAANTGKPFVAMGGSKVERVAFSLRDLLPDEMLDRIEATVAMAFGVPPVVLGALVGLRNSPWSQMSEARRMAYDDTIVPLWRRLERVLTRQLLKPMGGDPSLCLRFDTADIPALQEDESARIADAAAATFWTLDERRQHTGQEPLGGELGEWIQATSNPEPSDPEEEEEDEKAVDPRAFKWHVFDLMTKAQEETWTRTAEGLLQDDLSEWLDELAESPTFEAEWAAASLTDSTAAREDAETMVGHLAPKVEARRRAAWLAGLGERITDTGRSAVKDVARETGVAFDVLIDSLAEYTDRHAGELIEDLSETTRKRMAEALAAGLENASPSYVTGSGSPPGSAGLEPS